MPVPVRTEVVSLRDLAHRDGIVVRVAPPGDVTMGEGLAPDLDYNLDAAMECGDVTADERACVELFDGTFEPWFWANLDRGGDFASEIRRRHGDWRATAPARDVLGVGWSGIGGMSMLFDDAALGVAWEVAALALEGGGGDAACADALSRAWDTPSATRFVDVATPVLERVRADVALHGADAFRAARGVVAERRAERMRAILRREADRVRDQTDGIRAAMATRPGRERDASPGRKARRQARRVLTRSYALLSSVAGTPRARACLDGDAITVEGRRFDFRVRVRDARRAAHGAVDVSVTDKDHVELASLCVYMRDTPALDQVAGLILHVVAGDEDEIIRAANVIAMTERGSAHEAFRQVRGSREVTVEGPFPSPGTRASQPRPVEALRDRLAIPSRAAFGAHLLSTWAWLGEATGDPAWVASLVGVRDLDALGAPACLDLLAAAR